MMNVIHTNKARTVIRWGLYPFSWIVVGTIVYLFLSGKLEAQTAWMINAAILAPLYFVVEWRFPYEKRWSMTLTSFISDLKFVIINSTFLSAITSVLALFTISLSGNTEGMASTWPIPFQLLLCFLIFEAINYSLHRAMHEHKGTIGKTLWKIHAAHHLPPRLYILMHAVFHPLNSLLIQPLAIIFPVWLMGYSQQTVTIFLMVMGMHGLISHFNADIRMGWFNYVFVGNEVHRYHHSADVHEAKNYGAMLTIYDQLFGTFVYKPGLPPENLGVPKSSGLPDYDQTIKVLCIPFARHRGQ